MTRSKLEEHALNMRAHATSKDRTHFEREVAGAIAELCERVALAESIAALAVTPLRAIDQMLKIGAGEQSRKPAKRSRRTAPGKQ